MSMQETVLTEPQADEILSRIPANAEEARQIAQSIANGWNLRVSLSGQEQESGNAA